MGRLNGYSYVIGLLLIAGICFPWVTASGATLRVRPRKGFQLDFVVLPYKDQVIAVRAPESMYVSFQKPDKVQMIELDHFRKGSPSYHLEKNGWWTQTEEGHNTKYVSRLRLNKTGERIDLIYRAFNKSKENWKAAWFRTCLAPPKIFRDPSLTRTYVVDRHGKLRKLSELVDGHNINFISIKGGQSTCQLLPPSRWSPEWRYPDSRLAETVIMTESEDGKTTLLTGSERAYGLETGFHGPCIHSDGMTGPIPAGGKGEVRSFVALIKGKAKDGLRYYQKWRKSLTKPGAQ